jgi:TP901 family phage tail tape measure protein
MAIRIPILTSFDPKGLKQANSQLAKLGGSVRSLGKNLAIAGAALGAFGAITVRTFANFDAAMTKSTAIMGDMSDDMRKKMADTARDVAKSTTFSAEQAAESYYFLASAGLDAAASMAAMPQVAKFAQAGMFDMAKATDLLTDAQSALGMAIKGDPIKNLAEMTRLSDVLVRAATLANASVEQFSESLTTKAGSALKNINKDVEEGAAVLAVFADQGIKGKLAGSQLAIVIRDLTAKANSNKAAFAALGINIEDSNGKIANFADIIGDLEGALEGMTVLQQKATLTTLGFTDKSVSSIQALLGSSAAIRGYEKDLRSASGFTDTVASKQLLTFNAQVELLKSAFEDVGISVGEQLTPAFSKLIPALQASLPLLGEKLVAAVNQVDWDKLVGSVIKFTNFLIENAATIGKVILTIFVLNTAFKAMSVAIGIVNVAIALKTWYLAQLAAGMTATTIAATALSTAMKAIPFVAVVVGIAAIGVELTKVMPKFVQFRERLDDTGSGLSKATNDITAFTVATLKLQNMLSPMLRLFKDLTMGIANFILQLKGIPNRIPVNIDVTSNIGGGRPMTGGASRNLFTDSDIASSVTGGMAGATSAGGAGAAKKSIATGLQALTGTLKLEGKKATKAAALAGAGLSEGLVGQIIGSKTPLKTANQVLKKAVATQGASAAKLQKQFNKTAAGQSEMAAIASQAAAAAAQAAAEMQRAQEAAARAEAEALAERERVYNSFLDTVKATFAGIKNSILGAFDLGQLGGSTNAITRNMEKLLVRLRSFATNVKNLSGMGLDPALLQQVIAMGPLAGARLAQTLVAGGANALASINAGFGEFGMLSSQIAQTGTESLFGSQAQQTVYNINVDGGVGSGATIGKAIVEAIKAYERTSGAVWQGA